MLRFVLASLVFALAVGCSGPSFQRGSEDPSIDKAAMSTGLDRVDLEGALDDWYEEFGSSKFLGRHEGGEETIAVLRIDNDTSEHIGSALRNLIDSVETRLVNDGDFSVVSNDAIAKQAIAAEFLRGDAVDASTMAELGKQLGVHYFVSGRVGETAEKTSDARRVQYFLFLRVVEVETVRNVFQAQIDITKQISG
ncbi:MAG: hypothetical protein ACI9EF_001686 [Pseudohongiellaceae bacterium]|jgi:hypothetical protein